MSNRKEFLVDGKPLPDGFFINKWFASRFDANKNVLLVVVGGTGSGKSWSCIGMAESWYKYRFKDKKFPIENIVFSLSDGAKRLKGSTLDKSEFIIVEEVGVIANALDFQNRIVKMFNYILQSVRCKNIGIIFNLPSFSLLNKTGRSLAHGVFETVSIKKQTQQVILKPKGLQTNAITGKIYPKYLRQRIGNKIIAPRRLKVGRPTPELVEPYEKKKQSFVESQIDGLIVETSEDKGGKEKDEMYEKYKNFWRQISHYELEGYSQVEICKKLNVKRGIIAKHQGLKAEYDEFRPKHLENADNWAKSHVQTPPLLNS